VCSAKRRKCSLHPDSCRFATDLSKKLSTLDIVYWVKLRPTKPVLDVGS
jgi:hypothetical protein